MDIRALLSRDLAVPWLALRAEASPSQNDLLAEALSVAASLPRGPTGALHVAIACRSVRHFAPAFLGALAASATVQLLPNTQTSTLERAAAESDFLLHDAEIQEGKEHGIFLPPLLRKVSRSSGVGVPTAAEATSPQVVLSTSGTTGRPGESRKTIKQLVTEAEALAPLFAGARCVLSTVPPFHLFGLMFGLILPLRSGARVAHDPGFFLTDIATSIRAHTVDTIISTPAHLSSMLQAEMPKGLRVFSSGARLKDVLHYALMSTHDFHVTDILGSTETGGIASRSVPLAHWTPLSGVQLTTDEIRSPWCDEGMQPLRDVIELFPDGTFVHAGRRDDVVKVAGKRASLAALEDLLRTIPGVADVAVWQDTTAPGEPRLRCAIASAAGAAPSKEDIRRAVTQEFDPVFAPRQVVFVDSLPRAATGKLTRDALSSLFQGTTKPLVRELPLEVLQDGRVSCVLLPNFVFFQGHFPGLPILPGTALIDRIVVPAVLLLHPDLRTVRSMQRIRFSKTVTPHQHLTTKVSRNGERVSFEVQCAGGIVATGVLVFRSPEELG